MLEHARACSSLSDLCARVPHHQSYDPAHTTPAGSPADPGCYRLARHCRTSLSLRMDPPRLTGPTQEQVCVTGSKLPHSQSQLLHYHGRNPQISERLSMIWLFWPEPRVRLGSARPDACCHVGPTLKWRAPPALPLTGVTALQSKAHTHTKIGSHCHKSNRLRNSAPGSGRQSASLALPPVTRSEGAREAHQHQVRSGRLTDSPFLP